LHKNNENNNEDEDDDYEYEDKNIDDYNQMKRNKMGNLNTS
jgi:hypothetical protein